MSKKILSIALAVLLCAVLLVGCSPKEKPGSVYYLNFKPEADPYWQDLAKVYTKEIGVAVSVVTAASGQYESTLKAEVAKTQAPTLFQVNGPVGLASWKDYCYDLTGSAILNELTNDGFMLKNGSEIAGVAFALESYGIIYNKELLGIAGYTEDDIRSLDDLRTVAEDITARKAELGFAAFTSAGMDGSSDWRFKTHLANLPLYYEYRADSISSTAAVKGTYLDGYKAIWDVYINNSTCSPNLLSTKTGDDSAAEFVTKQAVFFQNGTWMYDVVSEIGDEHLGMLPIYIGVEGEENQGLCTGTENYWCVNRKASQADIDATLAFIHWVVTSETGTKAICSDMGFVIPFKKNLPATNALVNIANDYVAKGFIPVSWNFTTMPSESWKNELGSALTAYSAGSGDWSAVKAAFVDGWAAEYKASNG